ncbi:MAG: glycerophosphodiester phosphodiesterase family protein [candidate division KSB1 bacterium]|nr:glycerophosphodiester phosphodiesterase family protein [candidate division KSB1 bacterium]
MAKSFDDPFLVLAHRGASREAPENTLAAFRRAFALGVDGIELDVQLTADGELIVIHDDTVNRTTNGRGRVERKTLAELQALDAGKWFSEQFAGERLPSLAQVLDEAEGVLVDVEIKKCRDSELLKERLSALIPPHKANAFLITSFDSSIIEEFKTMRPDLRTGLLLNGRRKSAGSWEFVLPHHRLVDNLFCARAAEAGKKIIVWTVDEEREVNRLLQLGVGRFITNEPQKVQKIVQSAKNGLTII